MDCRLPFQGSFFFSEEMYHERVGIEIAFCFKVRSFYEEMRHEKVSTNV